MKLERPTLFVTGASGVLGGRLAQILTARFEVVAAHHDSPHPPGLRGVRLDLRAPTALEGALEAARPDAILHSAALADPDRCERVPELAEALNVAATARIARWARTQRVRLVTLSTDLVFPGDRSFWSETDSPRPLSTYARTKLQGEIEALNADPDAAIARVALVCGRGYGPRGTASESIAWKLAAGEGVRLFPDQFRTPVDPESVAAALTALLTGHASGIFHLGGAERLSRFDLGQRVARLLGLPQGLIEPVRFEAVPAAAPRPPDVSLDVSRALRELAFRPRALDEAILEGRRTPPPHL